MVPLALALEVWGALRSTPLGAVLSTRSHKAPGSGDPLRLWPPETGVCENATVTFASNYGELSNRMRLRKREQLSLCATEELCGFPLQFPTAFQKPKLLHAEKEKVVLKVYLLFLMKCCFLWWETLLLHDRPGIRPLLGETKPCSFRLKGIFGGVCKFVFFSCTSLGLHCCGWTRHWVPYCEAGCNHTW